MSLGDYLRLLRAKRGGITPWDIEASTTLTKGLYRQMEQRYRAVGDDESIRILADFYATSFDDLRWRLDWPRKGLSRALLAAQQNGEPLTLYMWNGEQVKGHVRWWDLGAVGIAPEPGEACDLVVVQRHAVERWDPRGPEPGEDEDEDDEEEEEAGDVPFQR